MDTSFFIESEFWDSIHDWRAEPAVRTYIRIP